jgi:hypothetical protein
MKSHVKMHTHYYEVDFPHHHNGPTPLPHIPGRGHPDGNGATATLGTPIWSSCLLDMGLIPDAYSSAVHECYYCILGVKDT